MRSAGKAVKFVGSLEQAEAIPDLELIDALICGDHFQTEDVKRLMKKSRGIATKTTWIIISGTSSAITASPMNIDQQVYFYDTDTGVIRESFVINTERVDNEVGRVSQTGEGLAVEWMTEGFLERRSNLHGSVLSVMVSDQVPYIEGTSLGTNFTSMPSGALVSEVDEDALSGMFNDINKIFMREMNFTSKNYFRKGTINNNCYINCHNF